ncbi:ferrous iron transport protein A [Sporolactobacillus kofuensis]|uniref:Ferrous iron transport protein A n=1 Tax=Sporolactobacillus kofuensis TaxID=269672 RepID=A0ABW1WDQ9_9BACL|nr:FeoA family protein [Sporolactobacillus kofuensis]MCO7176699.1 ferrous iron transport protein A [Sporolactobacillus kofuensis]
MDDVNRSVLGNEHTVCRQEAKEEKNRNALPLSLVHAGDSVCVKWISGKGETRRLLSTLGFVENTLLTVISEMDGNVIVNIKGTRVAVSKVMARRVMTE